MAAKSVPIADEDRLAIVRDLARELVSQAGNTVANAVAKAAKMAARESSSILTPPQAAYMLQVSVSRVLGLINDRTLPAANIARPGKQRPRWRITRAAVLDYLASKATVQAPAATLPLPPRRRRGQGKDEVIKFFG